MCLNSFELLDDNDCVDLDSDMLLVFIFNNHTSFKTSHKNFKLSNHCLDLVSVTCMRFSLTPSFIARPKGCVCLNSSSPFICSVAFVDNDTSICLPLSLIKVTLHVAHVF